MKIYGHRGAAGLALENSHESMQAALQYSLDAIEFDVHLTKDDQIVVLHDKHTKRIAEEKALVRKKTLTELRALTLNNKQHIPTLDEVLSALDDSGVIIDIKDRGVAEKMPDVLARHPKIKPIFASFIHEELRVIRKLMPDAPTYVLEHFSPIEIIHSARSLGATGIGLNKWLMNPLAYRLAKRYHLQFYVYTLNSPWLGRFYHRFYPDVAICTDHPERFVKRKPKQRTTRVPRPLVRQK
jgi:glycerophosphoryl diester phosphodiesterase